jgi:regulator of nonsense transcripts 2
MHHFALSYTYIFITIRYCPNLLIRLVDRILEEVQRGLDAPHKREPQRLLGLVRLLGELYNYSVVSAPVIFELLYTVINYGHRIPGTGTSDASGTGAGTGSTSTTAASQPSTTTTSTTTTPATASGGSGVATILSLPSVPATVAQAPHQYDTRLPSDLDPPGDLFRAQLVCEALNTCGAYYVRGQAKERLTRFLVYFQRYLLTKPLLPTHIEFAVLDCFDSLEELARAAAIEVALKARQSALAQSSGKALKAPTVVALTAIVTAEVNTAGAQFPRYDSMEGVQAAIEALEVKPEEKQEDQDGYGNAEEEEEAEVEVEYGEEDEEGMRGVRAGGGGDREGGDGEEGEGEAGREVEDDGQDEEEERLRILQAEEVQYSAV